MDDLKPMGEFFVHVARLGLEGKPDDLRLYLGRVARHARKSDPTLADSISQVLEDTRTRSYARRVPSVERADGLPDDSHLPEHVLKSAGESALIEQPILAPEVQTTMDRLLAEWKRAPDLRRVGLEPSASAIFTGPPGVGKTITARWLARELGLPIYVLDLTTVMSSRLGQSGANLRAALDYARREPSVLFLDEIDSIAKRRGDDSDVGELKRLVTIMLQELDSWPATSLLLAATNHPELVDRALWRRFDLEVAFGLPTDAETAVAIERYLGSDFARLARYQDALIEFYAGRSISDTRRSLLGVRRQLTLSTTPASELVESLIASEASGMSRGERNSLARTLSATGVMSERQLSRATGVSRDTLRKQRREMIDHGGK